MISLDPRPVIVVEDDVILRFFQVLLDPDTPAERVSAFARWFAVDLADFEGWCHRVRAQVGGIYPASVRLVGSQEAFRAALPEAVAVIVESLRVGSVELAMAKKLRAVQQFGTITANLDSEACLKAGVQVFTQRRRVSAACAEMALALMLALAKQLHRIVGRISVEQLKASGYSPVTFDRGHTALSGWSQITGVRVLNEATLGIVGLGQIGRELAVRAAAFGMRVLYYQRHRLPESEEQRWQASYASLDSLLAASDWVSIHLPLTVETKDLFDRALLARMKAGACLINTSQAGIVDRDAVIEALESGHLGGLGLDTLYEEPGRSDDALLGFNNVVMTPHMAAQPKFNTLDDAEEIVIRLAGAMRMEARVGYPALP